MLKLILSILPLAFAAAWSPTILSVSVCNVSVKTNPYKRGLYFFIGTAIPALVTSSLVVLIISLLGEGLTLKGFHKGLISSYIDLGLGIALLLVGALIIYRHRKKQSISTEPTVPKSNDKTDTRILPVFLLGLYMMTTNFSTIFFSIPAVNIIGLSESSIASKVVATLILNAFVLAPSLVPLLLFKYDPKLVHKYLSPFATWINAHMYEVIIFFVLGTGIYLAFMGAIGVLLRIYL